MIVTIDAYRTITQDTTSTDAVVTAALSDAQAILEERLGRQLESAERTEVYDVVGGYVYPAVTPITAIATGGEIDGAAIAVDAAGETTTITYTAGYTTATLPRILARAIVKIARAHLTATTTDSQHSSVKVGDVQVNYVKDAGDPFASQDVLKAVALYQRRRL